MVDYEFLDYKYFLPIRWVFHCWVTPPSKRWEFSKWRWYLLDWKKTPQQLVIENLVALKEDAYFLRDAYSCLLANNATSLIGFIEFSKRLYGQYEQGYVEFINPFGKLERTDLK
jgi:hypothetical protein